MFLEVKKRKAIHLDIRESQNYKRVAEATGILAPQCGGRQEGTGWGRSPWADSEGQVRLPLALNAQHWVSLDVYSGCTKNKYIYPLLEFKPRVLSHFFCCCI